MPHPEEQAFEHAQKHKLLLARAPRGLRFAASAGGGWNGDDRKQLASACRADHFEVGLPLSSLVLGLGLGLGLELILGPARLFVVLGGRVSPRIALRGGTSTSTSTSTSRAGRDVPLLELYVSVGGWGGVRSVYGGS